MDARDRFMRATMGGTQGSSSYGVGSSSGGSGSGSGSGSGGGSGGGNNQQVIQQALAAQAAQKKKQEELERKQAEELEAKIAREKKQFNIEDIPSLTLQAAIGGAKGLELLLDKLFKPELKDFSNPNFLAVLNAAFKSGKLNKDEYTEKYEDLLDDVYSGQAKEDLEAGLGSFDSEDLFDLAMEEATAKVKPGSGTQRITDPVSYYEETGTPQTSGSLADLASLDAQQYLSGDNYNPEFAQMIFNARMELDRMGKNPMTGNPQGIMAAGLPMGQHPLMNMNIPGPTDDGSFKILENILTPTPQQTVRSPPGQTELVGTAQGIAPFDINQFYASLPSYSQQGVMSPSLMEYYRNLGLFPRV